MNYKRFSLEKNEGVYSDYRTPLARLFRANPTEGEIHLHRDFAAVAYNAKDRMSY